MSRIVFIGWGNVAQQFSKQFQTIGFEVAQVVTKNSKTTFPTIQNISKIDLSADVYFLAVPDDQLLTLVEQLPCLPGLVLHCSGSFGKEILSKHDRNGVFYPLQTFRKETTVEFLEVPFFLDSSKEEDLHLMQTWVKKWGGKTYFMTSEQKQKIHLAAVWAMNFSNAMYVVSEKILQELDVPFEILKPLLLQALKNALEVGPKNAQTGPAIRFDQNLMEKQSLQMTQELEKTIYLAVSQLIQENA